jgi:hypothetical protein
VRRRSRHNIIPQPKLVNDRRVIYAIAGRHRRAKGIAKGMENATEWWCMVRPFRMDETLKGDGE